MIYTGVQYDPELSSLNPMQEGQHAPECQKNQPACVPCLYSVLAYNMICYIHKITIGHKF